MKLLLPLLSAVLIGLQIAGVINWPWYALMSPILIPLALIPVFFIGLALIACTVALLNDTQ